jgi:hypothetical protein
MQFIYKFEKILLPLGLMRTLHPVFKRTEKFIQTLKIFILPKG